MKKIFTLLICFLILCGCSNNSSYKYRVGVIQLAKHDALDSATQGFIDVLKEKFGDDIFIDVQVAAGDSSTCALMAGNFVAEDVDLIMCNATPALQSTKQATSSIPILGTSVTEYGVALGINNFDGLVGGNISGTSDLAPLDQQANMFKELLPNVKKIGLVYCSSEDNSIYQVDTIEKYLVNLGFEVKKYGFSDANLLDATVTSACDENDALYIPTDNTCADNGTIIANAANKKNIPIITGEKNTLVSCGGLATLSIDYYDLGRTTGNMAIEVLTGEKDISNMEIQYCDNFEKLYSASKAKQFNVDISDDYIAIEE